MQRGDLIRINGFKNGESIVAIVLFVGKEAVEIYNTSTQSRVWINNFIHSSYLEVLCKSET